MKIIVGLGNPGEKYTDTRHNAGFLVVDMLAQEHNTTFHKSASDDALIAETMIDDEKLLLVKPQTFMNKSGETVRSLLRNTNAEPEDFLIIYDDIDLPLGEIRFRETGSAGGHNGMRSVLSVFPNDARIARLRIGVGRPKNPNVPMKKWVLQQWGDMETRELPEIMDAAIEKTEDWYA
jgi:PTH1 family peptidyl-tRNA hydrolase